MTSRFRLALLVAAMGLSVSLGAVSATAGTNPGFGGASDFSGSSGYAPRVPISALARPAAWFDPSRLHFSTSVSVGTGSGGGTNTLSTMSFRYDFGMPLSVNVAVGNAWGPGAANGNQFFLQGLDVGYRPFQSLFIRVQYQDVRSPLQLSPDQRYAPFWGY